MSDSVRPHRRQPTRLPRPWDPPGKYTGVGCHFLLQCMKVKSESEVTQSCPTLSNPKDYSPAGSSVHGIFQARVLEWVAIAFSRIYVYLWLIHIDVWQKPTQQYKAIISQSEFTKHVYICVCVCMFTFQVFLKFNTLLLIILSHKFRLLHLALFIFL